MTDEEYVRSKWAPEAIRVLGADVFVSLNLGPWYPGWGPAAEFTRAREKQIAEVEEQIAWTQRTIELAKVSLKMGGFEGNESAHTELFDCIAINGRILAHLEPIKAELQRGMLAEPRKHEGEVNP